MPHCKPEAEAFSKILDYVQVDPQAAMMFEDSMKNIRAAKELGLYTVLVHEQIEDDRSIFQNMDKTVRSDESVDHVLNNCNEIPTKLSFLWKQT